MTKLTIEIDQSLLDAVARQEGRPLGEVLSELVVKGLAQQKARASREATAPGPTGPAGLEWISKPMGAVFDVADKDALDGIQVREDRERLGLDGAR